MVIGSIMDGRTNGVRKIETAIINAGFLGEACTKI
jgi:hypothetical protein